MPAAALSDGNVNFRWRDSAHADKKRLMCLTLDEFLRGFLLHLLPRGFVRIRNFGFLARKYIAHLKSGFLQVAVSQSPTHSRTAAQPNVGDPDRALRLCRHYAPTSVLFDCQCNIT